LGEQRKELESLEEAGWENLGKHIEKERWRTVENADLVGRKSLKIRKE
jgi:hypothetical protein